MGTALGSLQFAVPRCGAGIEKVALDGREISLASGAPFDPGLEPGAAIQGRRRRARRHPIPPAAFARRCRRRRSSASASIHSRSRGHSRSRASCANSTAPSPIVSRRRSAVRDDTGGVVGARVAELGQRQSPPGQHAVGLALDHLQDRASCQVLLNGRERVERSLGQARNGPADAAPAPMAANGKVRSSRSSHNSSNAVESNGSAPGTP